MTKYYKTFARKKLIKPTFSEFLFFFFLTLAVGGDGHDDDEAVPKDD